MKDIFKLSEDGKTLLSFTDKGVTHVIIPYGVVEIGKCAFYNSSSIQSIVIPDGVTMLQNQILLLHICKQ